MDNIKVKANDKGYRINFTVENADATPKDLTDYTIKFKVWEAMMPEPLLVYSDCVIYVALDGTCYYTVAEGDFVVPGIYRGELELTRGEIIESSDNFEVDIQESGG